MATAALNVGFGTPFQAQIDYLRQKLRLPTERWDDIASAAHDRAFVVAGAAKADLLADLHQAVIKAAEGGGLPAFRKDFKALVAKNGWTGWTGEGTKEGEAWRTRVIYQTNLATSYAAGRRAQLSEPGVLKLRPYWRYIHSDGVLNPRPQHLAWHGLTLRHDHPFWDTHYPPCGWGCQCRVESVSRLEGEASARAGLDEPPAGWDRLDPKTGAPVGIDKGFDYAPGASVLRPMQELIDDKLVKLDAPLGAQVWEALKPVLALERQQQWWDTLDAWQATAPAQRQAVVGALRLDTLDWLAAEKAVTPQSAAISVAEALVSGTPQGAMLAQDWRRLPDILDAPEAVYFDTRTEHLVYVASSGESARLSVEVDQTGQVVSGFRQAAKAIAGLVLSGLYALLH